MKWYHSNKLNNKTSVAVMRHSEIAVTEHMDSPGFYVKCILSLLKQFLETFTGKKERVMLPLTANMMIIKMIMNCFCVVLLTNIGRLALFASRTIFRDSHQHESRTHREQGLNSHKT